jgi:hypothetical protein
MLQDQGRLCAGTPPNLWPKYEEYPPCMLFLHTLPIDAKNIWPSSKRHVSFRLSHSKQRLLERMGRRHHTAFAGRSDCLNSYSNSSTFPICLAMSGPAVLRICVVVAIPRSVHLTPNSSIKKLQILRPPRGALSCIFSQTRKAFVRMARYMVFL